MGHGGKQTRRPSPRRRASPPFLGSYWLKIPVRSVEKFSISNLYSLRREKTFHPGWHIGKQAVKSGFSVCQILGFGWIRGVGNSQDAGIRLGDKEHAQEVQCRFIHGILLKMIAD